MASPVAQPVRSTLLDGNHAFPPLYACYLLRSKTKPNVTYIGSSPDPPRRLRQHNGELAAGAWSTSKYRPWEMQMIVYGFPSKLTALQFEWAWQKPDLSRHLKQASVVTEEAPTEETGIEAAETEVLKALFPRHANRNRMETKMAVARTMLTRTPFSRWPLHVRIFTKDAWEVWNEFKLVNHEPEVAISAPKAKGTRKASVKRKPKNPPRTFDPLPEMTTVMLDLGGVDGKTGKREEGTKGVTRLDGPIDVEDTEFRNEVWAKWKRSRNRGTKWACVVCRENIEDVDNHLNVAFCTATLPSGSLSPDPDANNQDRECNAIAHLPCLAKHFLSYPGPSQTRNEQPANLILPHTGECPSCFTRLSWGEIVRGIFARREGEKEDEELAEKTRIRDMKAAEAADKKRKAERQREEKRRVAEEAREEKRRLKETEKLGKAVTRRKGKARDMELSDTD